MYSNPAARMSMDSIAPLSPTSSRAEFPFHRQGSVASTTATSARRGSAASSIHSVGGQLDSSGRSSHSSLHEIGQNAISTLLQPPIVRTGLVAHTSAPASSAHKPPTARDIPPVTLTNLTRVDVNEFKTYLSQVGALHETLRRAKESDEDTNTDIFRRHGKPDEVSIDENHLKPRSRPSSSSSRKASSASFNALPPLETPTIRRRSSSNFNKKATQGPPPLSTIPNVYFDDDFHLENPRTFDVVSERSEVVRQPANTNQDKNVANGSAAAAPRKTLATNAILQEKLSWYMDTVEMHLISSISTASTTFFTALGSLRELHSEAADSVDRIKTLRKELEALDEEIATTGLDVVQKKRRRENLQQLNDAVHQLKEIVEGVSVCESQVDSGELEQALASIETLEGLIAGERTVTSNQDKPRLPDIRLRDLRGAVALEGVNDDLSTLRIRIGKAYESNFSNILLKDLRNHVSTVSNQEVLLRWSSSAIRARGGLSREPSAFPAYLAATEDLRAQLMPVLAGLQKSKHVTVAVAAYREVILREVKNLVRKPLPSSNDDDNETIRSSSTNSSRHLTQQEKSSILARNLRALDEGDAEELLLKIYISVTETLRRLSTQIKVLFDAASMIGEPVDITTELRSPQPLKSPALNSANRELQEDIHLTMDMASLLNQSVDVAQEKIVKVLRVRSDQSTRLPLVWFLRYFTLNLYFANECEAISGRSGTSLKTIVNSHIKDFIQLYGDTEKQKLAQAMESDQWSAKDFTEDDTTLLNRILESSTRDAAAWSEGSNIWEPYPDDEEGSNGRPRAESNGTKEKTRSAVIDGENFILPNSAVLCLRGMSHFLHLISSIPSMATDISNSLISYLQLFNSRCTQLILGAGAMKSAGLRNITTKHLALAAQALSFIATLIPHVREFVRRHAATGPNVNNAAVASLMGEFDKVRRLFQEYQNNIYDKSVEIIMGRANLHVKTMKALDWNQQSEASVNLYMEALVKETVVLHRVLSKHLPEGTVQMIMVQVFDGFQNHLGPALEDLHPENNIGITRMEQDIDYFVARLGKIEGFGDTGNKLLGVVKEKKVESPPEEEKEKEKEEDKADGENGEKAKTTGNGDASEGESRRSDEKSGGEEAKQKGPG